MTTRNWTTTYRLAGPCGDGCHAYVNERGAFIGPGVALVERVRDQHGKTRFAPRPMAHLDAILAKGYGAPLDGRRLAEHLLAVGRALDAGDLARAAVALVHAKLPPLADDRAVRRLAKLDADLRAAFAKRHPLAAAKYSPDQPRVLAGQHGGGQWTRGGNASFTDDVADRSNGPDERHAEFLPFFARPPFVVRPPIARPPLVRPPSVRPPLEEYPTEPTKPPGPEWEWKGDNPTPGSREGNWHNPKTKESLHPDLDHAEPEGPHWDYRAPDGTWYRWFPDGRMEPKPITPPPLSPTPELSGAPFA